MPFIKPERRKQIADLELRGELEPGDLCYIFYLPMVEQWKKQPSWTTAHNIYKNFVSEFDFLPSEDERIAARLAWEVFFQLHVMPYELKKREENGDI